MRKFNKKTYNLKYQTNQCLTQSQWLNTQNLCKYTWFRQLMNSPGLYLLGFRPLHQNIGQKHFVLTRLSQFSLKECNFIFLQILMFGQNNLYVDLTVSVEQEKCNLSKGMSDGMHVVSRLGQWNIWFLPSTKAWILFEEKIFLGKTYFSRISNHQSLE